MSDSRSRNVKKFSVFSPVVPSFHMRDMCGGPVPAGVTGRAAGTWGQAQPPATAPRTAPTWSTYTQPTKHHLSVSIFSVTCSIPEPYKHCYFYLIGMLQDSTLLTNLRPAPSILHPPSAAAARVKPSDSFPSRPSVYPSAVSLWRGKRNLEIRCCVKFKITVTVSN